MPMPAPPKHRPRIECLESIQRLLENQLRGGAGIFALDQLPRRKRPICKTERPVQARQSPRGVFPAPAALEQKNRRQQQEADKGNRPAAPGGGQKSCKRQSQQRRRDRIEGSSQDAPLSPLAPLPTQ